MPGRSLLSILLLVALIIPFTTDASILIHEKLSLDGSIRIRAEYEDGNSKPGQQWVRQIYLRSLLGLTISPDETFDLRIKFRTSRILGTNYTNSATVEKVELQEGYILTHSAMRIPFDVQLGRYEMMYGRRRLLGNGNWNNLGPRTYDGLRVRLDQPGYQLDGFWVQLTNAIYEGYRTAVWGDYSTYLFGIAGSFFSGHLQPLIYHMTDSDPVRNSEDTYLLGDQTTIAIYSPSTIGNVAINLDIAAQFGRNSTRLNYPDDVVDQLGWLLAFDATWSPNLPYDPRFGLGLDATTGTSPADQWTGENHGFYAPLMSRHVYRGYMDQFTDVAYGLADWFVTLGWTPLENTSVDATLHIFRSMVDNSDNSVPEDAGTHYNRHPIQLGEELDILIRRQISGGLDAEILFGSFFNSRRWGTDDNLFHFAALSLVGHF
ncbi:alginate export family protein [bacterium]|nr:alginate export family protein [bacterium]